MDEIALSTTGPATCDQCGHEYRVVMWDPMRPCPECGWDPAEDGSKHEL